MSIKQLAATCAGVILVLAACSSGGGSSASATASPAGSSVPAAPSPGASSVPSAATACRETTEAGAVTVSIKDFAFEPTAVTARVGQVIAFRNTGSAPHNATTDAGGCATRTLQTDQGDGLVFAVAGRYPFHCSVHPQMTGTITVEG